MNNELTFDIVINYTYNRILCVRYYFLSLCMLFCCHNVGKNNYLKTLCRVCIYLCGDRQVWRYIFVVFRTVGWKNKSTFVE